MIKKTLIACILFCMFSVVCHGADDNWSVNEPIFEESGITKIVHSEDSGYGNYTSYRYIPDVECNSFTAEIRFKKPSSNMFLIRTGFANKYTGVLVRGQYTSMTAGYNLYNIGVTPNTVIGRLENDINPDYPDFENGWMTLYFSVNGETGEYMGYLNDNTVLFTGNFLATSDNLSWIEFSVRQDSSDEVNSSMYIDYIKLKPGVNEIIPQNKTHRKLVRKTDFEGQGIGNIHYGLFGFRTLAETAVNIVEDPINQKNRCAMISSNDSVTSYISVDTRCDNLDLKFKVYIPKGAYTQIPLIATKNKNYVGALSANATYNLTGGGYSKFKVGEWNDIHWILNDDEILVSVNGGEYSRIEADVQNISSIRFAVWDNNVPVYLDDIEITEYDKGLFLYNRGESESGKYGQRLFLYPSDECTVYYTLDGTEPDQNAIRYTDTGINLYSDEPIRIKARGYRNSEPGYLYDFGEYVADTEHGLIFTPTVSSGGKLKFNIINSEAEQEVLVAGACYKDGRLTYINSKKVVCVEGENKFTLDIKDGMTVKAFVWSGDDIYPLTDTAVYTREEYSDTGLPLPKRNALKPLIASSREESLIAEKIVSGNTLCSVNLSADYSEDELVLKMSVSDILYSESDAVWIYIDGYNEKTSYYDENDIKIETTRSGVCNICDITAVTVETDAGFECTLHIPSKYISENKILQGKIIGFDFGYFDNDNDSVTLKWGTANNDISTSAFGVLIFD